MLKANAILMQANEAISPYGIVKYSGIMHNAMGRIHNMILTKCLSDIIVSKLRKEYYLKAYGFMKYMININKVRVAKHRLFQKQIQKQ